jgi:RND superfamily putative drug exporter
MLFYQGTFMASMGAAGAIVVAVAVIYGLTFLPALLSIIGPNVNRLRVPFFRWRSTGGFWGALAHWVMKRPVVVLVPTVAFLLVAGTPFLNIRLANGNVDMLPWRLEARQGFDHLIKDFPGEDQTTFDVVVNYPDGTPLTAQRIADQYALDRRLASIPGVLHTTGIYDLDPNLTLADYQAMYTGDASKLPPGAQQALAGYVGKHIVLLQATSSADPSTDAARNIVKAIRADQGVGDGGQLLVTGETAIDVDVIKFIYDQTPLAVGVVVLVTYVLLFLLTGSVVLPLKAIVMNFLSVGASFGALVFIFQQGHFANILGFTPQSLDPSIPVILFSIVFGLSMDYEVLLVSRIHEEYVRLGNNTAAVASGLERTGRLITGAAAIMFAVFMAFGLAEVVIIKAIGIGLAIAVAIDATIVRSLVVPAIMRLLGDLNWWAPHPLRWLYDRIGIGDLGVEPLPAQAHAQEVA